MNFIEVDLVRHLGWFKIVIEMVGVLFASLDELLTIVEVSGAEEGL